MAEALWQHMKLQKVWVGWSQKEQKSDKVPAVRRVEMRTLSLWEVYNHEDRIDLERSLPIDSRTNVGSATSRQLFGCKVHSLSRSLWPSGIGSHLGRNRLWVRFLAVSDIYSMFIEPTITWGSDGLTQKLCWKKKWDQRWRILDKIDICYLLCSKGISSARESQQDLLAKHWGDNEQFVIDI